MANILISFVMRLSWASLMPIVNEALSFTPQMGNGLFIRLLHGLCHHGFTRWYLSGSHWLPLYHFGKLTCHGSYYGIDEYHRYYTYGWVLRFLLGIVSGPVQASCLSAIGDYFGPNQRGAAVGIFMSCTSLGLTTVNLYAPYVATNYGWQNAFLLTAVLPTLVFILSYFHGS